MNERLELIKKGAEDWWGRVVQFEPPPPISIFPYFHRSLGQRCHRIFTSPHSARSPCGLSSHVQQQTMSPEIPKDVNALSSHNVFPFLSTLVDNDLFPHFPISFSFCFHTFLLVTVCSVSLFSTCGHCACTRVGIKVFMLLFSLIFFCSPGIAFHFRKGNSLPGNLRSLARQETNPSGRPPVSSHHCPLFQ